MSSLSSAAGIQPCGRWFGFYDIQRNNVSFQKNYSRLTVTLKKDVLGFFGSDFHIKIKNGTHTYNLINSCQRVVQTIKLSALRSSLWPLPKV